MAHGPGHSGQHSPHGTPLAQHPNAWGARATSGPSGLGVGTTALRILYVSDSLMAGGIESQLVELLTRLNPTRFHSRVLCLYGPHVRGLHFAPRLRAAGIPVTTLDLGWSAQDKLRAIRRIIATVWASRPEIIQAEGYHANLLTRLARPFLPPVQLIGTVRGMETTKQLLYERLSHWCCATLVASGTHLSSALVHRAGIAASKIHVIPNAIDTTRFAAPLDPTLRQRIAPGMRRVLVSMGRISKQKRMHLIAQALGMLKEQGRLPNDVRVMIVGPVEDQRMQAQLEAAVSHYELGGHLIQHHETDTPEDYLHACDASILFTTLEGISCAMLESLAAGRPVIISEDANAARVVEHGVNGWAVPTNDVAALADALHAVFTLPTDALERMHGTCQTSASKFDIHPLVERYMALYEEIAGK